MKKTVPHNVARPLVHFVLCYILGIIGGNIFLHKKYVSLFVYFLIVFISMLVYAFYYSLKDMMGLLISLGIGLFIFVAMPLHQESKLFKANQIYELEGQILPGVVGISNVPPSSVLFSMSNCAISSLSNLLSYPVSCIYSTIFII